MPLSVGDKLGSTKSLAPIGAGVAKTDGNVQLMGTEAKINPARSSDRKSS
jgi:hypothetical protein